MGFPDLQAYNSPHWITAPDGVILYLHTVIQRKSYYHASLILIYIVHIINLMLDQI